MNVLFKILIFFVTYSIVWFFLRTNDYYTREILLVDLADLGGVPWLYSVMGIMFSILAAFVIQNEWQFWTLLMGSVKEETGALEQLWLWSHHFPHDVKMRIHRAIHEYLTLTIQGGLEKGAGEAAHDPVEPVLGSLRDTIFGLADRPELLFTTFSMFAEIVRHHRNRLYYSSRHMPELLRGTLIFADSLIIVLALFIGVKNIWLDYTFTVSIAMLAYLIYLVVDDLDHPLRPGIWHLTPAHYQRLLKKMQPADEAPTPSRYV
jgi:hypothetical protein